MPRIGRYSRGDRFAVVGVNFRTGGQHPINRFEISAKIARQDLDRRRGLLMNRPDRPSKMVGTPVGHIVAGHRGDDDMRKTQLFDRAGHSIRFLRIGRAGSTMLYTTKTTIPSAEIAENHHRRRATRKTFHPVRTIRLVADGRQPVVVQDPTGRADSAFGYLQFQPPGQFFWPGRIRIGH